MGRTEDLMTVDKAEEAALPPPGVADLGKNNNGRSLDFQCITQFIAFHSFRNGSQRSQLYS